MTTTKVSPGWPVNSRGEIIFSQGSGNTTPVATLNEAFLPIDDATGGIAAVGLGGGGSSKFSANGTLADGTPVVVALGGTVNSVYLVSVNPASGDTITVESGTSSTGPWTTWSNGAVTSADYAVLVPQTPANTHVRFTRSAGTGTTSKYYINEE